MPVLIDEKTLHNCNYVISFLTTINTKQEITFTKFNFKEIKIENNSIVNESEIKQLLFPIYNKNLLFLNNREIENLLMQISFIDSFKIKKKYPEYFELSKFLKKYR